MENNLFKDIDQKMGKIHPDAGFSKYYFYLLSA